MKYLESWSVYESKDKTITIEGYHGSKSLIEEFRFPLFLSTSNHRAASFAVHMNWNEKTGRNEYWSLKGGEEGYLYHIRVDNATLLPWKGGAEDERLIKSGDITIVKVEKVGVRKVMNMYQPYIIPDSTI
jgi:hypothetical protein